MTSPTARPKGFGILGVGAAACVACCAGPILAVLGAIGLVSTLLFGVVGFALAVAVAAAIIALRRRRAAACASDPGPVPIEMSRRP